MKTTTEASKWTTYEMTYSEFCAKLGIPERPAVISVFVSPYSGTVEIRAVSEAEDLPPGELPQSIRLGTVYNTLYYCSPEVKHEWRPRRWRRPICSKCGEKQHRPRRQA